MQPVTFSTVHLLYTVKERGGKSDRKPPPSLWIKKSIHRNLKSENYKDYEQKPQQNFTIMNSDSGPASEISFRNGSRL